MQISATVGRPYPIGVSYYGNDINFSFYCKEKKCGIVFYEKNTSNEVLRIPFLEEGMEGSLHFMTISGIDRRKIVYRYYVNDTLVVDPNAHIYYEERGYGQNSEAPKFCGFLPLRYDWNGDESPELSYEESIVYCLHVRGFTKHSSSQVPIKQRGTFKGIMGKVPYLKELGITTLELQPMYEFDEREKKDFRMAAFSKLSMDGDGEKLEPERLLNYWGYTLGQYFSPKLTYGCTHDVISEFRSLVKKLHENKMEVVMQFYFPKDYPCQWILDILRFWSWEYHVDGFHIKGSDLPVQMILSEGGLSKKKIWFERESLEGNQENIYWCNQYLAEYCGSYRNNLRRFLKGDEGSLSNALYEMREKQGNRGRINYFTNYDGFTLMDMVSYDRKHNEENGEFNHDGCEYNYSWNCGEEGSTRKKTVKALRVKQIKNAFCFLFTSQGTPLIFMGDEFGNTQNGNNNPYCQDNEITWLNWRFLKKNAEIYNFLKEIIEFRKNFWILHMKNGLRLMDYRAYGYPDLSYHGEEPWHPKMENYMRHIGLMYCAKYGEESKKEKFLYFAVNMHWEGHEFGLPKVMEGTQWKILYSTDEVKIKRDGSNCSIGVSPRSIAILSGNIE